MTDSLSFAMLARLEDEPGEKTENPLKRIDGIAYSGGAVSQAWSPDPVFIDLASFHFRPQIPIMVDHETDSVDARVGECRANIDGGQVHISGVIDTAIPRGKYLADRGRRIAWQLSVGASGGDAKRYPKDWTGQINGRQVHGPAVVCTDFTLHEVSIVSIGADPNTTLEISAKFPSSTQSNPQTEEVPKMTEQTQEAAVQATDNTEAIRAAIAADRRRIQEINRIAADQPEIAAAAIENGDSVETTAVKVLEKLRASAPVAAMNIIVPKAADAPVNGNVFKAAIMQTAGISDDARVKACGQKAVEAADRSHRGMGIQELLLEAAKRNGYDGGYRVTLGNVDNVLRAADNDGGSAGGDSIGGDTDGGSKTPVAKTISVGGILGGVIDRRLADGFDAIDQTWKAISEIIAVKDFRQIQTYELTSTGEFAKVADDGTISAGGLGHSDRTNQADLYGEIISLTMKDIVNDDLSAFAKLPFVLGQEAALALNKVFWTELLDDADFFKEANSNILYSKALTVENLSSAITQFRNLRNSSGHRIGGTPEILLVPTELETTANEIYENQFAKASISNVHRGKYRPVVSPYLSDSDITGYNASAWYLLGNPARRAVMQVAFLNGNMAPTVQTGEPEFNKLGISYRAYHAFGCAKNCADAGIRVMSTAKQV